MVRSYQYELKARSALYAKESHRIEADLDLRGSETTESTNKGGHEEGD